MISLGTERHRKYLKEIDEMKVVGCFALTELGYGNNAVEMETRAGLFTTLLNQFILNVFLRYRLGSSYQRIHHQHAICSCSKVLDHEWIL
jgi:hypothetical protein